MHKGYTRTDNVDKQVQRIFYNSSLAYSESEYPFQSVPSTEDLKSLRVNLALYKEKLQNQFQKCRNYIKEVSRSNSNSSGILKEIILENIGKKSKSHLLKHMYKMGLNIKEATGENETIIVVDLSPISTDKEALNKFLSFIDKVRDKQYKFNKTQRIGGILSKEVKNESLKTKLNDENKCTQEQIDKKAIYYKNKYEQSCFCHNSKQCIPSKLAISHENITYDQNENVYFALQPNYYVSGASFRLQETSFEETVSKSNKKTTKDDESKNFYKKNSNTKNLQLNKSQALIKRKIKHNPKIISEDAVNMTKKNNNVRLNTNSTLQNLFVTTLPSSDNKAIINKNKKKLKQMSKKSTFNKLLNFLKLFTFNKKKATKKRKKKENSLPVNVSVAQVYSVFSEQYENENNSKNNTTNLERKVSLNTSVVLVKNLEENDSKTSDTLSSDRQQLQDEKNEDISLEEETSVLEEKPAVAWGRQVWCESKKELELVLRQKRQPKAIKNVTTFISDKLNEAEKDKELEKILNQQNEIKGMIESIQNTLQRSEKPSKSDEYVQTTLLSRTTMSKYNEETCTCKYTRNTSEPWSERATISCNETSYCKHSFYDSMTNIPSSNCWCPDIYEKLKTVCKCLYTKPKLERNVQCELEDQRREIIRLNKLLNLHLMENHPS